MTETAKKTPEEELLEKAKAGEGAGAMKEGETGDSGAGDGESDEQKLIKQLQGQLEESNKRITTLQSERDAERSAKDSARKSAMTAAEQKVRAQEEAIASNLTAAQNAFKAARQKLRDAKDSGDFDKEEEALIEFNDAQMKLRGAEWSDAKFKEWKEKTGGKVVVSDSGSNFTAKEQAWIDKHPRFNSDELYRGVVYAAHDKAKEKGIEIDSDEYFSHIEASLRKAGLEDDEGHDTSNRKEEKKDPPKTDNPAPKKSDKQSTGAPPNGSGGNPSGNSGGGKKTFVMTPEHRRAAQINFPDDYAKDPKKAEEKYAAYQLQIQEKKARGEL